jgi:hypothetical protein
MCQSAQQRRELNQKRRSILPRLPMGAKEMLFFGSSQFHHHHRRRRHSPSFSSIIQMARCLRLVASHVYTPFVTRTLSRLGVFYCSCMRGGMQQNNDQNWAPPSSSHHPRISNARPKCWRFHGSHNEGTVMLTLALLLNVKRRDVCGWLAG